MRTGSVSVVALMTSCFHNWNINEWKKNRVGDDHSSFIPRSLLHLSVFFLSLHLQPYLVFLLSHPIFVHLSFVHGCFHIFRLSIASYFHPSISSNSTSSHLCICSLFLIVKLFLLCASFNFPAFFSSLFFLRDVFFFNRFIFLIGSYLYNVSAFFHFHLYQTVSFLICTPFPSRFTPLPPHLSVLPSFPRVLHVTFFIFCFQSPLFPQLYVSPLSLNVSFIAFSYIHHYPIFPLFIYLSFPINFPSCCRLSIFLCPIFSSLCLSFVLLACPLFYFSLTSLLLLTLIFIPPSHVTGLALRLNYPVKIISLVTDNISTPH